MHRTHDREGGAEGDQTPVSRASRGRSFTELRPHVGYIANPLLGLHGGSVHCFFHERTGSLLHDSLLGRPTRPQPSRPKDLF